MQQYLDGHYKAEIALQTMLSS